VKKIFLIAGEASGDIHGANMIRHLNKVTDFSLYGTGGNNLKELGQLQYFDVADMTIIGISEVVQKLPFIVKMFKTLKKKLLEVDPDLVILIDYPGFNLRFAKYAKKHGYKVIYYIAPQVWAWHYSRIKAIKKYIDFVYCILPFEEEIFKSEGIPALYVGNPIMDQIKFRFESKDQFLKYCNITDGKPIVGLLPGSRKKEIEDNMPVFRKAIEQFHGRYNFILAKAPSVKDEWLNRYLEGVDIKIIEDGYDVMKYADLLWCCSGTATLEAAIIGTPAIVVYKLSAFTMVFINILIFLKIIKIKMIGLPNIVLGEQIFPELVNKDFSINNLLWHTHFILGRKKEVENKLSCFENLFIRLNPSENVVKHMHENFLK
jgi:lipid-A-disaccharide synthase